MQSIMDVIQKAMQNKKGEIIIDPRAQIDLFSPADLSSGHYTNSIDARPEHVLMNYYFLSRHLNIVSSAKNGSMYMGP